MKYSRVIVFVLLVTGFLFSAAQAQVPTHGTVISITDGDTFVLDDGSKVRLAGINAPETNHHLTPPHISGMI